MEDKKSHITGETFVATKIQSEVNFIWLRNAILTHLIGKKLEV